MSKIVAKKPILGLEAAITAQYEGAGAKKSERKAKISILAFLRCEDITKGLGGSIQAFHDLNLCFPQIQAEP